MIILRQKAFSMRAEHVEKIMASPSNLKELPQPIQKYY